VFYVKVDDRLPRRLVAADAPPALVPLRQALKTIDGQLTDYIGQARMTA